MPDNTQWAKYGLFGRLVGTYWAKEGDDSGEVTTFDVRRDANNSEGIYRDVIYTKKDYRRMPYRAYLRTGATDTLYNSNILSERWYLLADGSILHDVGNLWELESPTRLRLSHVKVRGRTYTHRAPPRTFIYTRLGPQQVALVRKGQAELEARLAQKSSQSGGDNGVLGALAMGVGAALAGGNAEQVMGMAMKGAELTTDNEMSRNVLSGQGDAMVASGTQRMIDENARTSSGGSMSRTTAAGASGGEGPTGTLPARSNGSPARKLTMFCFAWGQNNLIQYKSQLGSRDVSIEDQGLWQEEMKQEFANRSGAALSAVACHYNETGEQFVTSTQAEKDNATLVQWSPH